MLQENMWKCDYFESQYLILMTRIWGIWGPPFSSCIGLCGAQENTFGINFHHHGSSGVL